MIKHHRAARDAAAIVFQAVGLRLDPRPHSKHPKFAVVDATGATRAYLILSSTPRSGETEQRNMARQQANRIIVRLGL